MKTFRLLCGSLLLLTFINNLELMGQTGPVFPVVNVVATDPDAAESGLLAAIFPGRFTFYREPVNTNVLIVNFALSGSAANGTDYRYISNRVRFNPGQAEVRVDVFPLNDNLVEGTENVVVTLTPPPCAYIVPPPPECYSPGPSNRAEVFIKDANTPPENHPPYVQLNEPRNGDVFTAPTNIVLRAYADDAEDGNQLTVEFLANGNSIGFGTFVPTLCPAPYCPFFALVWSNPPPGNYTLVARATDKAGAGSNSAPVNIAVRSEGPLHPAPDSQEWPAVASDGVNFFAVWMDRRDGGAWNAYDIYGARISTNGEVLDRNGIAICTGPGANFYPSVAFDGQNYFVIWSDDRDNAPGTPRNEIYGARVTREGRVLDPNGFKVTHGEIAYQPTVAFNGSTYLVAAYARQHNGQVGDTVIAVRVTPAGVVLDTEEMVLFGPQGYLAPVVAASVGGDWLVAWNYGGIQAALVRQDGSVSAPRYIGNRGDTWMRGLTAVGNNYFLTMVANRQLNSDTVVMDIYGTWIDAAGQAFKTVLVSSNASHSTGSGSGQPTIHLQNHATAAGTGSEALVVWEAGAVYTNGGNQRWTSDVRGARVTTSGSVSAPITICSAPQDQALPSLAFNGRQFLAVWEDARSAPPNEENPFNAYDIYGARLTTTGNVVDANGFLISSVVSNRPPQVTITVPDDGAVFDQSETIRIEAVTFDPDGFASTVEFFANEQKIGEATVRPGAPGQPLGFEFNWTDAPVGQHRLTARAIDNGGARGVSAPVNITVREPDNHELHIVGIYSGAVTGSANHEEGRAAVFVDRPGKLVTLFLSAYEPVLWSISASAGTTIERVYLIGYYPGRVEGIAPDVEVIREWINYYIGYSVDSAQFYRTAPKVRRLTGLEISSFHGSSTAPYPTPFVIDGVQHDPRLLANYPVPTPLSELLDLSFTLSFYSGGAGVFAVDYTLAGPNDGGDFVHRGDQAVAGNEGKYYVLGDDNVLQIDPAGGSRELPVPASLPEMNSPVSVAYDNVRNRVLLVTLGGEGFLYAYSPTEDRWSVLSSMNGLDLGTLTYHAAEDALYGVGTSHPDSGGQLTLYRFTPEGGRAGDLPLPLYPWGVDMNSSQLVSVGEYLVLLLNPSGVGSDLNAEDQEARIYLINPVTSETWLTVRQPKPIRPNEPPQVRITAPTDGAVFAASASIQITAVAEGTTSYATKVEFFANGTKIGETMIPPQTGGNVFNFTWQNVQAGAYALTAKATDFRDGVGISAPVNIRVGPVPPPTCGCDAPWRNHGEYVSCVIRHAWALYRAGEITNEQRRAMIHDAVQSDCGKHPPERERACIHLFPLTREECQRDGLQFVLSGDAAGPCVLECSEDLVHWRTVEPVSITGWEITCPMEAGTRARFYRVRADQ